jgi:hypothetical protein
VNEPLHLTTANSASASLTYCSLVFDLDARGRKEGRTVEEREKRKTRSVELFLKAETALFHQEIPTDNKTFCRAPD